MSEERAKLSKYKVIYCPHCYSEIKLNLAQRRKEESIQCEECNKAIELSEAEEFIRKLSPTKRGPCPNCGTLLYYDIEDRVEDTLIECPRCHDKFYIDEVYQNIDTEVKFGDVPTTNRSMPTASGKYTPLSIIAFIFAFIAPPLGFILGIVAKKEINNTEEGNDGLATAAIVIGILWGVLLFGLLYSSY